MKIADIAKHNKKDDCWVIIHGKAYNLTEFLNEHPGGQKVILKFAGLDATAEFEKFHPPDMMDHFLDKRFHLGPVDNANTVKKPDQLSKKRPSLSSVLNLYDMESVAMSVLDQSAWAYYSSGAGNELTLRENQAAFQRIFLKPRVLINVKNIDTCTVMLGTKSSLPFYITATALGKLGHPEGEVILTRAAGTRRIIQMIPTLASCSLDEMLNSRIDGQTQWFQLYVNADRQLTKRLIEKAQEKVCAICITVDAPQLGRREKDMRVKFEEENPNIQQGQEVQRNEGAARAISTFIDASLSWSEIPWFRSITKVKLVIKGIQCGEDAVLAAKAGVDAIIISNHGGRQLDTCRSSIEILQEVVCHLREAGLSNRIELYIDGGVRRGSDIFKALALGANGVGIGRPFLYAMSAYGQRGVEYTIDLLREELEMTMRLMGVKSIKEIGPHHVLAEQLTKRFPIKDYLGDGAYLPLKPLVSKL